MGGYQSSSTSNSSQTDESNHEKEPESQAPMKESPDPATGGGPAADTEIKEDTAAPEGEEGEEEEVGECPFCLFMKEGGCRDEFVEWEKCVDEGEKNKEDIVEKCFEITGALKKCMEAHRDYYGPLLQAEEEAMKDLEKKGKGEEATNGSTGSETDSQEKTVNGSI